MVFSTKRQGGTLMDQSKNSCDDCNCMDEMNYHGHISHYCSCGYKYSKEPKKCKRFRGRDDGDSEEVKCVGL